MFMFDDGKNDQLPAWDAAILSFDAGDLWADLIDALRRGKVRGQGEAMPRHHLELMASFPVYDMREIGFAEIQLIQDSLDSIEAALTNPPNRALAFGTVGVPGKGRVNVVYITGVLNRSFANCDGEWAMSSSAMDDMKWGAVLNGLIDDAEANIEVRDAPTPRLDSINRGRAMASLPPLQRARVISLSTPRVQYENPVSGGRRHGAETGGSHARPVEHERRLTEMEIVCKDGRRWTRKAQTIVVNEGVARVTVVKP